ncbi:hypothetical protein [Candidatus Ichthyocystis sparus]|uniref:hypothetical protein n=1 Tax=Candidatus Ichthyocystis sparus TaxID=1561004 RepID=UPI000B8701EC|nr:hypothetical protein [Candidatus Ichthyocystis sparus]
MRPYNSSNNFTSSNIDDNKNIKNDTHDSTTEHICYENLHTSSNYGFNHCVGTIPKDEIPPRLLIFCTHDTSYQENNHEEDLLPPDIFKLTQLGESNLSSKLYSSDTDQPSTSRALKYQFIEDESLSTEPRPKVICLKQIVSNEKNYTASLDFTEKMTTASNLKNIEQTKKHLDTSKVPGWPIIKKEIRIKLCLCDIREIMCAEKTFNSSSLTSTEHITAKSTFTDNKRLSITPEPVIVEPKKISINKNTIKRNIILKSYRQHHINLWQTKTNSRIVYIDAIKKIGIDNNGLFKSSVLKKISKMIKINERINLLKSYINLSPTYSNIRKYILDKLSSLFEDNSVDLDILITPGMSISDLRSSFISNSIFFEKLSKSCEEAVKNINLVPNNCFSRIIQSHIYLDSPERLLITNKKNKLCSAIKRLITETISNLPNNITHELKKFNPNEIADGLFVNIHNVYLQKSLIRKIELIFNSNKLPDDKFISNLDFLNNLLTKIFIEVESHPVLHSGKTLFPGEHTAKLLSKYILSDMYNISTKIHKKLSLHEHTKDGTSESNYEKSSEINIHDNMKISLLKNHSLLIPQKKLKWNHNPVSPLYIYKLALSGIDIDKSNFKSSFIDKSKHYWSVIKHLSEKEKIDIDLSITYTNVKNYILETFSPFLKEIEEETRSKIKLTNGMTIDELRLSYASNEEFLDKLREFCNKVIISIKNPRNTILTDLIQSNVPLGTEISKKIRMKKGRKNSFLNEIKKLLITNISNIPEVLSESIKLLPHADIINGFFSNFYDMYVDNESLLKAKLIFDTIPLKVINDPLLSESVDKISLDIIDKIRKQNIIRIRRRSIINSNLICGKLSTYNYVKKLVKQELPTLKDSLSDHILTIRNNKIETADQKTRDEIFDKLGSDLVETIVISYNRLFVKKHKSKIK